MILNTGSRTDIPAFYSDWFYRRIQAGFVLTHNPYRPEQVLILFPDSPAPSACAFSLLASVHST